jgi:hypothetical protein
MGLNFYGLFWGRINDFHLFSGFLPRRMTNRVDLQVFQILIQVRHLPNVERRIMKMLNYHIEVLLVVARHHHDLVTRMRSCPHMSCMPQLNQAVLNQMPKEELDLQYRNHIVNSKNLRQMLKIIRVIQQVCSTVVYRIHTTVFLRNY